MEALHSQKTDPFRRPDKDLIRGVIYARFSSSGQREESISGQLRDCKKYADDNGITIVGEYIDRAISGRTDKRPDFQRMLRDSEKGIFDVVITWKIDRFARNRYDSALCKGRLKKNGVRVFYAKETIPDGPEGIILESVMEGYAEFYSADLRQKVKRGFYDSALECKALGPVCYGYRIGSDGRYEIEPAEARIVKRIFDEYASGMRMLDIYKRLNEEGYRTHRGKPFNKNSCRRILENRKYIGLYEYEDIRIEHGVPDIVSKEIFEKVQNMLEINHKAPSRSRGKDGFLLTTKLFCGKCGAPMTGDGGTSHTGQVYAYYNCNNRRYNHTCDKERVQKDLIEDIVVNDLYDILHTDGIIEEIADKVVEFQEKEMQDNSELKALEVRKKEAEKKRNNLLAAIEAGIITPSTKSRLVELESEIAAIERRITEELQTAPVIDRDKIVYFLQKCSEGDLHDFQYRAYLVDTFLNAVYLYDDDLLYVLNYSGEKAKITKKIAERALKGSGFAPLAAPEKSGHFENVRIIFLFLFCFLLIYGIFRIMKLRYNGFNNEITV